VRGYSSTWRHPPSLSQFRENSAVMLFVNKHKQQFLGREEVELEDLMAEKTCEGIYYFLSDFLGPLEDIFGVCMEFVWKGIKIGTCFETKLKMTKYHPYPIHIFRINAHNNPKLKISQIFTIGRTGK
jgi:hypothetical protein